MPEPRPGFPAPNFSLYDQDGKVVTLSDFRNKWVVLYFYPKDDTPGCTLEAREFTALKDEFDARDCVILGVSRDSPKQHCAFKDKYALDLRLLSDPHHTVLEQYSAWREKNLYGKIMLGIARSTVLIDPDGIVAHYWKNVRAKGHASAVLAKLKELQGDAPSQPSPSS
ncbi:peroxiredoxin [Candidatus Woesearchaeota archaeon]|nr:MAG: peroxiredoxin [Candidatus Woesearchaeota archaeon]